MKTQKRLIVSLVSALVLGAASSLALAHDCGKPDCSHRHNHGWQDHGRWDKSDCRHRRDRRWDKSDCRAHKKQRRVSAHFRREARRVLRDIEDLGRVREKCSNRRNCCDRDWDRKNW